MRSSGKRVINGNDFHQGELGEVCRSLDQFICYRLAGVTSAKHNGDCMSLPSSRSTGCSNQAQALWNGGRRLAARHLLSDAQTVAGVNGSGASGSSRESDSIGPMFVAVSYRSSNRRIFKNWDTCSEVLVSMDGSE